MVDNIPGLVATMGATGEVEFLNRQTLDDFGKTNEELKNWSLIGVVHPDDLPRVIESRARSIESGQIYEIEHRCLGADGIYRWFQVRGLRVRNAQGAVTAWYLIDAREPLDSDGTVLHWYDFICPFRYVGQQRNAILIHHGLHVDEPAFQAHPDIPSRGIPAGPRQGPMYALLEREAKEAGLALIGLPVFPTRGVPWLLLNRYVNSSRTTSRNSKRPICGALRTRRGYWRPRR